MNITLEKNGQVNALLHLNIGEEDYKPRVAKKTRELAATANVKGFRKGKVPPALIQKMYGKGLLVDVLNDMIAEQVDGYIRDNNLPILGNPMPTTGEPQDFDAQKEFKFSFELGLVPQFELPAPGELEVFRPAPGDKEIDNYIDNMRRRFGTMLKPEEVGDADLLAGELAQPERQFITKANLPLNKMNPESKGAFLGKTRGEVVTFELETAFDHQTLHEVTGVHHHHDGDEFGGQWNFTISEISRTSPAELGPDFYGKVFRNEGITEEGAFRQRVSALLTEAYDNDYQYFVENALRKYYLQNTQIELPAEFLKRWLKSQNEKLSDAQIDEEFPRYLDELKWTLVRNKVGEQLNLEIKHEDVLDHTKDLVRREFAQMGLPNMDEEEVEHFANTHLQQEQGKNYRSMFEKAFYARTLDHLKANAKLNLKEVTAEEFADKVSALMA